MRVIPTLATTLLIVGPLAADGPPEAPWAKSFAEAVEKASADNRLVLTIFIAKSDSLCRRLDREIAGDPRVAEQVRRFVPVKIDAEKEGEPLVESHKITRVPTLLFLDPAAPDGPVFAKIGGCMAPVPFADRLKTIADLRDELPGIEERLKANPDDVMALAKMSVLHHLRGEDERAADLLRKAERGDPANVQGHLTRAYNAVGDGYEDQRLYESAIEQFQKAAATAKDPKDAAYAKYSIIECYIALRKAAEAIPALEEYLKLPGLAKADQENARRLLARARRSVQLQRKKSDD